MGKKKGPAKPSATDVYNRAQTQFEQTQQPSATENEMGGLSQNMANNYNAAAGRNMQDYGDIMGGYQNFARNLAPPTRFSAPRPAELGESYGYLREAMPGYREFASTGGYSPQDIQELRARGISPIRAAYGNTMMELDRARSLGGGGGAPNYIAAASRAQREVPGQMADAMTTVNAGLADAIRQGKMFGLGGITQTGSTMGGLSSAEAGRQLQAQGMTEESLQNFNRNQLGALSGQAGLYGTSPGMASTFGNQALNAYQARAGMEGNRQNYGLGLLDAQLRATGADQNKTPWWKTALGVAGTVAPYVAMAASDENIKTDIKPIKGSISRALKSLPISTWKYKGDDTTHIGPMAQGFKKAFGVGDGKTIHLVDVMGVMLAAAKESHA